MKKILLAIMATTMLAGTVSAGELRIINNSWKRIETSDDRAVRRDGVYYNRSASGTHVNAGDQVSYYFRDYIPNADQTNTVAARVDVNGYGYNTFEIPRGNETRVVVYTGEFFWTSIQSEKVISGTQNNPENVSIDIR